jgi:hypothetical protein
MKRTKIARILLLSLLVIALLVGIQSTALARPTKTAVTGTGDLPPVPSTGVTWTDGAGNFHFRNLTFTGNVSLHGEGIAIQGTQTLVIDGYADPTQSGPFRGVYTIRAVVDGKDTILWDGRIEGFSMYAQSFANIVAQGQGPFKGTQLKLDFVENTPTPENPAPQTFQLAGQVLDPH